MNPQVFSILIYVLLLFLGMLVCLYLGKTKIGHSSGSGPIEGAVFALFGLLIAFTFSGAALRFENRRDLIIGESNSFSTAWSRLDLLKKEDQPEVRSLFTSFLDRRLAAYQEIPDNDKMMANILESEKIQGELWSRTVTACEARGEPATASFILGSLNDLFDDCATRSSATETHPPFIIFALLFALGLISALLAGNGPESEKSRNGFRIVCFTFVICLAVYVTLELEFPRLGMIRVDSADHLLIDFRESLK